MSRIRARLLLPLALVLPLAGEAAAADLYGAIAFSQTNGAAGYGTNFKGKRDAEKRAVSECRKAGGRDCAVVVWFMNACASLSSGNGYGFGYGWNADPDVAEKRGLAECRARDRGCEARVTVCTD